VRSRIAALKARIAEREPAYRAKKNARFWTLAFWKNLFNGSSSRDDALLEQHAKALASRRK